MSEPKAYLGDGVYADDDGYMLHLYLDNGNRKTDEIFLEDDVFAAMLRFVEKTRNVKIDIHPLDKEREG